MALSHLLAVAAAPAGSVVELRLQRSLSAADTQALRLLQALIARGAGLRFPSFSRALVESLATIHYPRALDESLTGRIVSLTAAGAAKGELGPLAADPDTLIALGAWYVGSIFTFPSRESQQTGPRHRARLSWWLSRIGAPVQGGLDAAFSVALSPIKRAAALGLAACPDVDPGALLAECAAQIFHPGHRGQAAPAAAAFATAALEDAPARRCTDVLGSAIVLATFWAEFLLQSEVENLSVSTPAAPPAPAK